MSKSPMSVFEKVNVSGELEILLTNTEITSLRLNMSKKKIAMQIKSKIIADRRLLNEYIKKLRGTYDAEDISIDITYDKELFGDECYSNLLNCVFEENPALKPYLISSEAVFSANSIHIKCGAGGQSMLEKSDCGGFIQNLIKKQFDIDAQVCFEYEDITVEDIEKYQSKKQQQMDNLIKEAVSATTEKTNTVKNNNSGVKSGEWALIHGKKVAGGLTPIANIEENSGRIAITGEVCFVELREGRSGQITFMFDVYDGSSSITCKLRGFEDKLSKVTGNIKKGKLVRLKGDAYYDKYVRELCIEPFDIEITEGESPRMDNASDKRVELHLHTQMSAMDAMTDVKQLIGRAASWGHKAVAITDHGVVQAFPDAYNEAKKHGIKVIYGVEAYLINDTESVCDKLYEIISSNQNNSYVVFDIETTGLSAVHDKITEIGAVKIVNGERVDSFSELINPEIPIPAEITKLTGITNSMVSDKETIKEILPRFVEFCGDSIVVAHNASFDVGFIKNNAKKLNLLFDNDEIDTLAVSRELFPELPKHKLNVVAKHLQVKLDNHHRAVDDSAATADIFLKSLSIIQEGKYGKNKKNMASYGKYYHAILLAKNSVGLKNIYKIVSKSHIEQFYKKPLVLKSQLAKNKEGLILGAACERGELFRALVNGKPQNEIEKIIDFYDYLEIQPIANNEFLVRNGNVANREKLVELNKKIVELGKKYNKPVVATCDVHFLDPKDEVYRRVLFGGQNYKDADTQPPLYFRTTEEMLDEFDYLGKDTAHEVVITNTNLIADMIENISPVADKLYPPQIKGADDELVKMCETRAKEIYGENLPQIVRDRMKAELDCIVKYGFSVMYVIAQKVVKKSNDDGYLVGSRGSVGSSFVAFLAGITEVNSLAPHYVCPKCKYCEFVDEEDVRCGADLNDKSCPECGETLVKDGHNIPFETFLDTSGKKIPDIDLNFSGEYQSTAHKYVEELFGTDYVFRAGTIGTIADKTAIGFAKKYYELKNETPHHAEVRRAATGSVGVKRTTGQHPGGIIIVPNDKEIYDFCPIQHPADDKNSGVITTHFDFHSIDNNLLKLDLLGHDDPTMLKMLEDLTKKDPREIPLDDKDTLSLFTGTEALGVKPSDINSPVGTFGVPEFGTRFVRQMLVDTKPTTFAELVLISGLSHGTDVWLNNAQDLIKNNTAVLSNVICVRDDIMLYLINKGLDADIAFAIMEEVRRGKVSKNPNDEKYMKFYDEMKKHDVPDWYIESCKKIKYMFPKAHAVAYVTMAFRVAWYKIKYPLEYYLAYFTVRADDFDAEIMANGVNTVVAKMKEIDEKIKNKESNDKDEKVYTILEICLEMYKRGYEFLPVDLYKSHPSKFLTVDGKILPPLTALQGLGVTAADNIAKCREEGRFLSQEELRRRAGLNKNVMEILDRNGSLAGLPASSQMSLF